MPPVPSDRDQQRRRTRIRPLSTSVREMRGSISRARDMVREQLAFELADLERPRTRADCINGPRPCPWVGCRHHLYLNVLPTRSIQVTWPDKEPDELERSCSLDEADDAKTLERVGDLTNLTRERVRQIVVEGVTKLRGGLGLDAKALAAPALDDEE